MQELVYFDSFSYVLSQMLFIKMLGLTYFLAFWSLFNQVLGLYGSQGIIPIQQTLQSLKKRLSPYPFMQLPTFFWLNSSDKSLRLLAGVGMGLSLFPLLGIFPAFALFLLWAIYLSFVSIGFVFLSFQWDTLLLEVGFIAIFFAIHSPPPILMLWGVWLLLFRLLFTSGIVKWLSGCPEWWNLTALEYHYETQPLPNRLAYYAHKLPTYLHQLSSIGTFIFESLVPFLIFGTPTMRAVAGFLSILFQCLLMSIGNYAFFNILTITLCVTLLNNASLEWLWPLTSMPETHGAFYSFTSLLLNGIGGIFIVLNVLLLFHQFIPIPLFQRFLKALAPFYILNTYGLFANMTTKRNEIIIEGSHDSQDWKIYEFKWKPGNLSTPPLQVAPYHPRLDWQMWFAALTPYEANPWLTNFLMRLLEGSKDVEGLLKVNPFPDAPPKFIRTLFYEYKFSDLDSKQAKGQWWIRSFEGYYAPILTIKNKDPTRLDMEHLDEEEF